MRRLVVTVAAVIACMLATKIPLYGVNYAATPDGGREIADPALLHSAQQFLSIGASGLAPVFLALWLSEIIRFFRGRRPANDASASGLSDDWLKWVALTFAVVLGVAKAASMESPPVSVTDPSWGMRLNCVVSTVAASMLMWWLARLITVEGIGSGLWLLLLVPILLLIVRAYPDAIAAASTVDLIVTVIYVLATVTAVILIQATLPDRRRGASSIWVPVLAQTAFSIALAIAWAISGQRAEPSGFEPWDTLRTFYPAHTLWVAGYCVLIVLASYREAWLVSDTGATWIIRGVLLAAIIIGGDLQSDLLLVHPLHLVIATLVATHAMSALGLSRHTTMALDVSAGSARLPP